MKKIQLNPLFMAGMLLLFAFVMSASAALAEGASLQSETALQHAQKHIDPTYVCPMHPQIVRDQPGNCPICGMDLVPAKQMAPIEREVSYYRHPHNPTVTSDRPKKDEMGMDYIAVYADGYAQDSDVRISPAVRNNMGVRSAVVGRDTLWRRIDTVGFVNYDEDRISHVHLRTDGWIEKLVVKSLGVRLKKGDLLFELYSPKLVNAQEEYLQALAGNNKQLRSASSERLRSLGISEKQVAQLKKSRKVRNTIGFYAPQDGVVSMLNVREGMYVPPATSVMSLVDLDSIWVIADVYEQQANWVRVGQSAEVALRHIPGRAWEGKVEYVYPNLDPKTRTLKVRLRFDNPDELLKPNMYADVVIYAGPKHDVLNIPREAVIRTGNSQRVIKDLGEGRFRPVEIESGIEVRDRIEILQGLFEGDRVVISGQFLLDSESSLKASFLRMQEGQETPVEQNAVDQMDHSQHESADHTTDHSQH